MIKESKLSNFAEENAPAICGILTFVVTSIILSRINADFSPTLISSISSLTTQIVATYLGLVLTSYAILHAVKFEVSSKSDDVKKQVSDLITLLHRSFVTTVWHLVALALFCYFVYLSSTALVDSAEIRSYMPGLGLSRYFFASLVGAMVWGSVEIGCAVVTLFNIRN